ncbi:MAG: gliding motility-associated C-terminal domain-containing protein [Saprospiraceae bacterium]|nr:gliding motility-associated C-terminal domain-containing protein [Saprospiraceae bacterium]MCF8250988.1 gliding motility-associated C-terminal domain-containing protein [Saprospiraceae bacterium]MCF8280317.1 gliding motility-associated C-terminal domain-containing protein [Bacteroidales bacterium]MCF8312844.1 gliding motility-associated C-terminal domain-containing protein [Saprospiraceae bacterium]MCF8441291.1 gliding motility-associated C-terminal domain-containing protein [Saprospiraceae 
MRRQLLRLALCACAIMALSPLFSQGQGLPRLHGEHGFCAQEVLWEAALRENPALRQQQDKMEQMLYEHLKKAQQSAKALPPLYVLPVVVHIIHDNGPENIPDATVIQGIQDLNDAFANVGYYDPATGVDTKMQFCLAQRDTLGYLTTGITRNQSPLTNMLMDVDDLTVKDLNRWDPTQYINIWLLREICDSGGGCGVAGYAYFPSSHGSPADGIMMEANFFGSSQGASGVQIHEMGHYLGLYHTFQGGCTNNDCLADGDRVCDTPPDQSTAAAPCGTAVNSCMTDTDSGFATDQNDLIEDYMDYGDFNCWSVFTQGQADRMQWHIENVRYSLLESKACLDPCTSPLAASFSVSATTVDVGTTVNFVNASSNVTNYNWKLDGAPFSMSANPSYTFGTEGSFEVCLEVGNVDPNCYSRQCVTIKVVCPVVPNFTASAALLFPGQSASFVNTSSNATAYTWLLNGATLGSSTDLDYTFSGSGLQTVCLTATNGICEATHCKNVAVMYVSGTGGCDTSYLKTYGSPLGDERGHALLEIPQNLGGGFLIGGGKGDSAMITRLDPSANIVWTRAFDPTPNAADFIWALNFDSNGNVIGSGQTRDEPQSNVECFVFKYNIPTNNILWVNELDIIDPAAEIYRSIFEKSPGGNYIVAGEVDQDPGLVNSNINGFLLEVNRNTGANVWQRNLTLGNAESFQKALLHNGAIYATGRYSFDPNGTARWRPGITRFDLNGNQQWSRLYLRPVTNTTTARLASSDMVADNGLVVLGHGDIAGTSTTNVSLFLFKTDDNGNLLWAMNYDIPAANSEVSTQLISVPDGYVCLGYYTAASQDVFIFKTDKQGQLLWSKSYGNASTEDAFDLVSSNGQIYFTGKTKPVTPGASYDLFFANIAEDGSLSVFDSCNLFTDLNITTSAIANPYSGQHNLTQLNQNWGQFLTDKPVGTTFIQSTTICLQPCIDSCEVLPDAQFVAASAACLGDSLEVSLTACNLGILDLPAGTPISFYFGDPTNTSAVLIATLPLPQALPKDSCSTFTFIIPAPPNAAIFIMLNDDGTTPLPFSLTDFDADIGECDYTNNLGSFTHSFTPPLLALGPDVFLCQNGVTVLDAGPGFASYHWHDGSSEQTLTAFGPGTYRISVTDACGGQQTDEVQVSVDSSTVLSLGPDIPICEGSSVALDVPGYVTYQWSPIDFLSCSECPNPTATPTANITYTLVATTADGCVGVDEVRISIAEPVTISTAIQLCAGETAFIFGMPVSAAGVFQGTFAAQNGCDSVVTVTVEALPTSVSNLTLYSCPGSTVSFASQTLTIGQTQDFTFQNYVGCDSVVTVTVAALPTSASSVTLFACPGSTVQYDSQTLTVGQIQDFTFQNYVGCDSVVTVTVAALPTSAGSLTLFGCPGSTVVYDSQTLTVGQTQVVTFQNTAGCDSVVTVTVAALPTSVSSLTLFGCPGSTVVYASQTLAVGQTQVVTFQNYIGCDSVVTVTVAALPTSASSLTLFGCPGSTVVYASQTLAVGQTQSFTFQNTAGCDSIVTVTVEGYTVDYQELTMMACPGEPAIIGGQMLMPGDTATFTYQNASGCDSVVVVMVGQLLAPAPSMLGVVLCPGDSLVYLGEVLRPGDLRTYTLQGQNGCDSLVTVLVTAHPAIAFGLLAEATCPNVAEGRIELNIAAGDQPLTASLDGGAFSPNDVYDGLSAGAHTVQVRDAHGCHASQSIEIQALPPLEVATEDYVLPCAEPTVTLRPMVLSHTGPLRWEWSGGWNKPWYHAGQPGVFTVRISDDCTTEERSMQVVWGEDGPTELFYVPNAFSPNGDGINDEFRVYLAEGAELLSFEFLVFDRWGDLLFTTTDPATGWNGVFREEPMKPAVMVWYVKAQVAVCGRIIGVFRKGGVMVMR